MTVKELKTILKYLNDDDVCYINSESTRVAYVHYVETPRSARRKPKRAVIIAAV